MIASISSHLGMTVCGFSAILAAAEVAFAAPTYYCELASVESIDGDRDNPSIKVALSFPLTMQANTGLALHPVFGNEYFANIEVLDQGSASSSLKVIAFSEEGECGLEANCTFRNATYIEIKTWAEGAAKPFVAVADGLVGQGSCR